VLLKGLNGKIPFLSFEPGELECPVKNFAPVAIGVWLGHEWSRWGGVGMCLGLRRLMGVEEGRCLVAIEEISEG
jgi:hypothetical protein